jgi:hypothetical protein
LSLERILKSRKYKYVDYEGLGNGILKGKWVGCPWILEVIKELITILLSAMSAGEEATELS